jgi:hypothetical protein
MRAVRLPGDEGPDQDCLQPNEGPIRMSRCAARRRYSGLGGTLTGRIDDLAS